MEPSLLDLEVIYYHFQVNFLIFAFMNKAKATKIPSIIVDDDPMNIAVLSDLLKESYPEIDVIGTARNGSEALESIKTLQPALVFLDVEMPDMNGFEVLQRLDKINFQTIFVTAHSQYAIQAIRFNALDYLLKPIDQQELSAAIKRFQSEGHAHINQSQVQVALDNLKKENPLDKVLYLPTQEGGIKMTLREIVRIEGERNYSTIHLSSGKSKLTSKTLGHFEEILYGRDFYRCHRSYIVSRLHIQELHREIFVLKDDTEIPISRRKKTDARHWYYEL